MQPAGVDKKPIISVNQIKDLPFSATRLIKSNVIINYATTPASVVRLKEGEGQK